MSQVEDYISKETLDQVSTDSFALNLANYRSLLLKWEREVDGDLPAGPRANLFLMESVMLQEVIGKQIRAAGPNARRLGVPPDELEDIKRIYLRVFQKLLLRVTQLVDLYSPQFEDAIKKIESLPEDARPEMLYRLTSHIHIARVAQGQMLNHPAAASLVLPAYFKAMEVIAEIFNSHPHILAASSPPAPPPRPPSSAGGGGDDGGIPRRVQKLEDKMESVSSDLAVIKSSLARMEEFLKHAAMKADIAQFATAHEQRLAPLATKVDLAAVKVDLTPIETRTGKAEERLTRIEERLTHMPTTAKMYLAGGAAVATLLGVMAKGFGWV